MEENEIKELLKDRNLRVVADRCGVNYFALVRWTRGETQNPSFKLINALQKYLAAPVKEAA